MIYNARNVCFTFNLSPPWSLEGQTQLVPSRAAPQEWFTLIPCAAVWGGLPTLSVYKEQKPSKHFFLQCFDLFKDQTISEEREELEK